MHSWLRVSIGCKWDPCQDPQETSQLAGLDVEFVLIFESKSKHSNININLEWSYLIYRIITSIHMDVDARIAHEIAIIVDNDLCKLGFPSLTTVLCKDRRVPSNSTVWLQLQPTLNKKFFDKNYINKAELSALKPPPLVPPSRRGLRASFVLSRSHHQPTCDKILPTRKTCAYGVMHWDGDMCPSWRVYISFL